MPESRRAIRSSFVGVQKTEASPTKAFKAGRRQLADLAALSYSRASSDPFLKGALPVSATIAELYQHDQFQAQRQVFKILGAAFRIKTLDGRLLAYSQQKAFKLRE